MIPEHFLEQQRAEIQAQAERKRAGMEYVARVVNSHEEQLRRFYQLEGAIDEVTLQTIYSDVQAALEHTANKALSTIGVNVRSGPRGYIPEDELEYQLGFLTLVPLFGDETNAGDPEEDIALTPVPTEYGISIVDGLRAARGEKSIKEERSANSKAFRDFLEAGQRF